MGYYPPHVLVTDAKGSGVEILPLDINQSLDNYTVEGGAIRVSLKQLKGMSDEALKSILSERAKGSFISLRDFVIRTNTNQSILENLVKVGAFDSLGSRSDLLLQLTGLTNLRHKIDKGTKPLFEYIKPNPGLSGEDVYADKKARMLVERELLSLDLSAHH